MIIMLICVGLLLAAIVGFNLFKSHMIAKMMASKRAAARHRDGYRGRLSDVAAAARRGRQSAPRCAASM